MTYALLLWPHANIRYMEALQTLARAELNCLMHALNRPVELHSTTLGGAPFLTFESDALSETELVALSSLSSFYMLCRLEDGKLLPIAPAFEWYLPADAAEVLKYKGKTNASFTALMINCALCASDFFPALAEERLTVLDPMCGRGTTLFCALRRGFDAAGIEIDKRDAKESVDYFSRYLKTHKYKHQMKNLSLTLPKGQNAPETRFTFASDAARYTSGDQRQLRLIQGDARQAALLMKPASAHLIICDLPYGVQHAPQDGRKPQTFEGLLAQCLPGFKKVLKPGGAAAFSFNTYTLRRDRLTQLLTDAGFEVLNDAPYNAFEHWVEQAVNRDLIIAR